MSISPAAFDILLSLHAGPSHGYAMIKAIQEHRGEKPMQPGLLYTTLPKLLEARLIEEVGAPVGSTDARRRYYQLTGQGQQVLAQEADRMLQQAQKINTLVRGLT